MRSFPVPSYIIENRRAVERGKKAKKVKEVNEKRESGRKGWKNV